MAIELHEPSPIASTASTVVQSGDGTVSANTAPVVFIMVTKGTIAAVTLPAPDHNGQLLVMVSTGVLAHIITGLFDAAGTTATFSAIVAGSAIFAGYLGRWRSVSLTGVAVT